MQKIDTVGVYILEIIESGIGLTKENQYPQWLARAKAVKKWVETPDEMAHFQITEPAYVDWTPYNEETEAYLVLFKSATELNDTTKLLNYEQLQLALGWPGVEFDSLCDGSYVGKLFQARLEENTYNNNTSIRVNWIDSADAPAQRQLRTIEADKVKGLTALLSGMKKAAPVKPVAAKPAAAKPVGKPSPAASPQTPAPTASDAGTNANATTTGTSPTPSAKTISPSKTPKAPKTTPPPPAPVKEGVAGLPKETDKLVAWEYVNVNKGKNTDDSIQEAWIAACSEVGEDRDEETFTDGDWAKVRDIVIRDLALTAVAA